MKNLVTEYLRNRLFRIRWKQANSKNSVVPQNRFKLDLVKVDVGSYGPIIVKSWGNKKEGLSIGKYCAISKGVTFILGGNHYIDSVSNFSFKNIYFDSSFPADSKGPIRIEDGVWIGTDAMILSGITIGKGAVIAARSVVVKNVLPYEVVGGNPARHIKFRFDEDMVKRLVELDFYSVMSRDTYMNNRGLFDDNLSRQSLNELESLISKKQ